MREEASDTYQTWSEEWEKRHQERIGDAIEAIQKLLPAPKACNMLYTPGLSVGLTPKRATRKTPGKGIGIEMEIIYKARQTK